MLDQALKEKRDGGQARVRVPRYCRATRGANIVWAVVVEEAPGANQGALTLRQGAPGSHGARATQRHLPCSDDVDNVGLLNVLALVLGWINFPVRHAVIMSAKPGPAT